MFFFTSFNEVFMSVTLFLLSFTFFFTSFSDSFKRSMFKFTSFTFFLFSSIPLFNSFNLSFISNTTLFDTLSSFELSLITRRIEVSNDVVFFAVSSTCSVRTFS